MRSPRRARRADAALCAGHEGLPSEVEYVRAGPTGRPMPRSASLNLIQAMEGPPHTDEAVVVRGVVMQRQLRLDAMEIGHEDRDSLVVLPQEAIRGRVTWVSGQVEVQRGRVGRSRVCVIGMNGPTPQ